MPANIGAEIQALPLEYMLGAPLAATIKAQALAAKTTIEFIETVGLAPGATAADPLVARTATFEFTQPVPDPANPGQVTNVQSILTVPLLSIVPTPYIRVSDLNVNFEFKIRDVQTAESKASITGSTGFSSTTTGSTKFGGGLAGFLGGPTGTLEQKTTVKLDVSATYQSTNRQSTDRSATFKMTLNAVQDLLPEGLARVLEILADAVRAQEKT
jgi:hypothetical protein